MSLYKALLSERRKRFAGGGPVSPYALQNLAMQRQIAAERDQNAVEASEGALSNTPQPGPSYDPSMEGTAPEYPADRTSGFAPRMLSAGMSDLSGGVKNALAATAQALGGSTLSHSLRKSASEDAMRAAKLTTDQIQNATDVPKAEHPFGAAMDYIAGQALRGLPMMGAMALGGAMAKRPMVGIAAPSAVLNTGGEYARAHGAIDEQEASGAMTPETAARLREGVPAHAFGAGAVNAGIDALTFGHVLHPNSFGPALAAKTLPGHVLRSSAIMAGGGAAREAVEQIATKHALENPDLSVSDHDALINAAAANAAGALPFTVPGHAGGKIGRGLDTVADAAGKAYHRIRGGAEDLADEYVPKVKSAATRYGEAVAGVIQDPKSILDNELVKKGVQAGKDFGQGVATAEPIQDAIGGLKERVAELPKTREAAKAALGRMSETVKDFMKSVPGKIDELAAKGEAYLAPKKSLVGPLSDDAKTIRDTLLQLQPQAKESDATLLAKRLEDVLTRSPKQVLLHISKPEVAKQILADFGLDPGAFAAEILNPLRAKDKTGLWGETEKHQRDVFGDAKVLDVNDQAVEGNAAADPHAGEEAPQGEEPDIGRAAGQLVMVDDPNETGSRHPAMTPEIFEAAKADEGQRHAAVDKAGSNAAVRVTRTRYDAETGEKLGEPTSEDAKVNLMDLSRAYSGQREAPEKAKLFGETEQRTYDDNFKQGAAALLNGWEETEPDGTKVKVSVEPLVGNKPLERDAVGDYEQNEMRKWLRPDSYTGPGRKFGEVENADLSRGLGQANLESALSSYQEQRRNQQDIWDKTYAVTEGSERKKRFVADKAVERTIDRAQNEVVRHFGEDFRTEVAGVPKDKQIEMIERAYQFLDRPGNKKGVARMLADLPESVLRDRKDDLYREISKIDDWAQEGQKGEQETSVDNPEFSTDKAITTVGRDAEGVRKEGLDNVSHHPAAIEEAGREAGFEAHRTQLYKTARDRLARLHQQATTEPGRAVLQRGLQFLRDRSDQLPESALRLIAEVKGISELTKALDTLDKPVRVKAALAEGASISQPKALRISREERDTQAKTRISAGALKYAKDRFEKSSAREDALGPPPEGLTAAQRADWVRAQLRQKGTEPALGTKNEVQSTKPKGAEPVEAEAGTSTKDSVVSTPEPKVEVAPGENIASPFRGRNTSPLAAALTNVTFSKFPVKDVPGLKKPDDPRHGLSAEGWYKANKGVSLPDNMRMMQKVIEAKLQQYPGLVKAIDEKGGRAWIEQSEHTVTGNERWEGKGMESNFLKVLADAYDAVKEKESPKAEAGPEAGGPEIQKSLYGIDQATTAVIKDFLERMPKHLQDYAQAAFQKNGVMGLLGALAEITKQLEDGLVVERKKAAEGDPEAQKTIDYIDKMRKSLAGVNTKETPIDSTDPVVQKRLIDELQKITGPSTAVAFDGKLSHQAQYDHARKLVTLAATQAFTPSNVHHEAFHAVYDSYLSPEDRKVVWKAFSSPGIKRQIKEFLKDSPDAWKAAKDKPEELMAYGFQAWKANAVKFGPNTSTVFGKIVALYQKIMNWLHDQPDAQRMMTRIADGYFADGQMSSPAEIALSKSSPVLKRVQQVTAPIFRYADKIYDNFLYPYDTRLGDMGNPHVDTIRRAFYSEVGEKRADRGMVQEIQLKTIKYLNALDKLVRSDPVGFEQALKNRAKDIAPSTPTEHALDRMLDEHHQYLTDAGVDIGYVKNYMPMPWSGEKIEAKRDAFIKMLEPHEEELLKVGFTPEKAADVMSRRGRMADEFLGEAFDANGAPQTNHVLDRVFSFLSNAEREQFVRDDLHGALQTYVKQIVRRAEWSRRFGDDSSGFEQLMTKAKEFGLSKEDEQVIRDYKDDAFAARLYKMNPTLRKAIAVNTVYQNYRVLGLSIMSNLIDPFGVAVRSGEWSDAWDSYKLAASRMFKSGQMRTKDLEALAEDIGSIQRASVQDALLERYGGVNIEGKLAKANQLLFKYNGMDGLTRSVRLAALVSGINFIKRHAKGFDDQSSRHLAELGLRKGDVHLRPDGELAVRPDEFVGMDRDKAETAAERVQGALNRFVDEASLRPNVGERTRWGSNPYLAPLYHLKQYVFTFNKVINKKLEHELLEHGNVTPYLMAASYIPIMAGSAMLRDMMLHGGSLPAQNGFMHYAWDQGVMRTGLMGPSDLAELGVSGLALGNVNDLRQLGGPTVAQAMDAIGAISSSSHVHSFGKFVAESAPGGSILQHFTP